jgi:hypothetical protein
MSESDRGNKNGSSNSNHDDDKNVKEEEEIVVTPQEDDGADGEPEPKDTKQVAGEKNEKSAGHKKDEETPPGEQQQDDRGGESKAKDTEQQVTESDAERQMNDKDELKDDNVEATPNDANDADLEAAEIAPDIEANMTAVATKSAEQVENQEVDEPSSPSAERSSSPETNQQQQQQQPTSSKKLFLIIFAIVLMVILVVLLSVFFFLTNRDGETAPDLEPSPFSNSTRYDDDAFGSYDTATDAPVIVPPFSNSIRQQKLLQYIVDQGVSEREDLLNPESPQGHALEFLANQDGLALDPPTGGLDTDEGYRFVTRYTMALFYYATNGTRWNYDLLFLSDSDTCEWYEIFEPPIGQVGVLCNQETQEIVGMSFSKFTRGRESKLAFEFFISTFLIPFSFHSS